MQHRELKLICYPSKNAADDVHQDCRGFVAKYLAQFPERPMVKLQSGQVVKTEYNGERGPEKLGREHIVERVHRIVIRLVSLRLMKVLLLQNLVQLRLNQLRCWFY